MPLFDPTTGKVLDRDALRSVQMRPGGFRRPWVKVDKENRTKSVEVVREDNGGQAGWHTFHWDGRVDATATPETVKVDLSKKE